MKKIFLILLSTTLLFSITRIDRVQDIKKKEKITVSKSYLQNIKSKVDKEWMTFVKEAGNAKISLIIDSKRGKIEKVIIISKVGNKKFKKEFKTFLRNLRNVRFKQILTKNGIIEVRMELKSINNTKNTWNKISLYKNKSHIMYENYLKFLQKEKNYSNKQIKKMLDNDKKTVTKMMLMALYYDYNKDNLEKAEKFYSIVIKTKLKRFISNEEGLFLVDYLLRTGQDKLVLEILPKFSCQFMKEPKRNECYYFRARSLYNLNDVSYELPLNIAKNKIRQGRTLYNEINNIKGKK